MGSHTLVLILARILGRGIFVAILVSIFGDPGNNFGKNLRCVNTNYNFGKNLGYRSLCYNLSKTLWYGNLSYSLSKNLGYGNPGNNFRKNFDFVHLG